MNISCPQCGSIISLTTLVRYQKTVQLELSPWLGRGWLMLHSSLLRLNTVTLHQQETASQELYSWDQEQHITAPRKGEPRVASGWPRYPPTSPRVKASLKIALLRKQGSLKLSHSCELCLVSPPRTAKCT